MNNYVTKQVKILSLSFLLISFGFGAVQYYQTVYFTQAKMIEVGFWSLILIYFVFTLFSPLAGIFVSKYGARKCMILASIFYFLFIFALLTKSIFWVYLASILLGVAASLLWIGQNSYLIRASDEKYYGTNSGFFSTITCLGGAFGVIILGFLIDKLSFDLPFLIYAVFPLFGLLTLFSLKDLRGEQKKNHFMLLRKSFTSPTALKLSSIGFIVNFVFGLTLGIIPIEIKNTLGLSYVGILSSLIYIFPIFFSYFFGRLSDIKGREKALSFSYLILLIGLVSLLFSKSAFFLVLGIILLSLNWALIGPILYALVGNIATASNLEFISALFWTIQNVGVVSALVVSQIFKSEVRLIYFISLLITGISFMVLLPLLRLKIEEIKERISREMLINL